jgi:glyceraldehyde 3-phosphate dehydrogenase
MQIALNGFGRIGRCVFRAIFEHNIKDVQIVGINDLTSPDMMAHLLSFDSVHGRFSEPFELANGELRIRDQVIKLTSERDPAQLPWADVDVAMDCTGFFKSRDKAGLHMQNGSSKVLVSAPGKDLDRTVVYGVNHQDLTANDTLVSNASCTTNCLAPVAKVLDDAFGIETGFMTTVHAYTGSQPMHDRPTSDPYRSRAGALSMIPTTTGAAKALASVLPHLDGKIDGAAIRVPTPNVSAVDLKFMPKRKASVDEINAVVKAAAEGSLKGVLDYDPRPKVSIDFNHDPHSSNFAPDQTRVTDGGMVRILSWYDNEWGFSNRMLDTARAMHAAKLSPPVGPRHDILCLGLYR